MEDYPTSVHWLPVDDQLQEIDLPEDVDLPGGEVRHVPAPGDFVCFGADTWEVMRRNWTIPVAMRGAMTPRQTCTLYIRQVEWPAALNR